MPLKIVRWIEFHIGDALCVLLGFLCKPRPLPREVRSLLVVRDWSLGESILALPMIRAYRRRFPQARIWVLVAPSSREVFRGHPLVDDIVDFNLPGLFRLFFRRFDLAVDAMPYFRHSALVARFTSRFVAGFDTFRRRSRLYDLEIPFDDRIHMTHMLDRLYAYGPLTSRRLVPLPRASLRDDDLIRALEGFPLRIGMHLGTEETAPWRAWSFERFQALVGMALETWPRAFIFLTGTENEREINEKMLERMGRERMTSLVGRCDLHQLAELLARLDLFVSSDTGPMHAAAAMGCPTVGLFGPNTPERFAPFPPWRHKALYNPPPGYQPTINVHKGEFGSEGDRSRGVIDRISPEEVLRAMTELLEERGKA